VSILITDVVSLAPELYVGMILGVVVALNSVPCSAWQNWHVCSCFPFL
jgi:hypothetical protein